MPRKPAPAAEVIDGATNPAALARATTAQNVVSAEAIQLKEAFGIETLEVDVLRQEVVNLINATGRALFMLGGRLATLHMVLPKEDFGALLDGIGLSRRVANRYMAAALKCVDADGQGRARLLSLPQSKVIELAALDEEQLTELEETGSLGQLALAFDDIDRMSTSELRKRLREAEQAAAAKDKVIAKKSQEIDRLHEAAERVSSDDAAAAAAQAQIDAIREATQAAESALLGLANVAADALSEAATEAVATAARTSVEYLAQWLADLIARHGVPVQFEEMVQPSWLAAGASSPKAKGKKG